MWGVFWGGLAAQRKEDLAALSLARAQRRKWRVLESNSDARLFPIIKEALEF